jgi:hypothetical protein
MARQPSTYASFQSLSSSVAWRDLDRRFRMKKPP